MNSLDQNGYRKYKKCSLAGFLDVSRLVRYYDALFKRFQLYRYIIRFVLIFPLFSAVILIIDTAPQWINLSIGILVASAVLIDFIFDFSTKAAITHTISLECSRLQNEWSKLWWLANSNHAEDSDVLQQNSILADKLINTTGRAGDAGISENKRLNEICTNDAFNYMEMKYVHPANVQ